MCNENVGVWGVIVMSQIFKEMNGCEQLKKGVQNVAILFLCHLIIEADLPHTSQILRNRITYY